MLAPGDLAPELGLPDADGRTWTLADLDGRPTVLYFYPADETPGCTRQACGLRDQWSAIQATGAQVFGISRDDASSHRAFASHHRLPFPLLTDAQGEVSKAYNAVSMVPFRKANRRVTYILDRQGHVAHILDPVDVDRHAADVLAALRNC